MKQRVHEGERQSFFDLAELTRESRRQPPCRRRRRRLSEDGGQSAGY